MSKTMTACALGASVMFLGQPTGAQDAVFWKSVGNWEVSIDPTIENGCYALASWDGGTVLRIGLNPEEDNFYMLIGNNSWPTLVPDTAYDISIKFDKRMPWDVSARGLQFAPGETVYLHAESNEFAFISEFMRSKQMQFSYGGSPVDALKLSGSSRAMKEVIACQKIADERAAITDVPPVGEEIAGDAIPLAEGDAE